MIARDQFKRVNSINFYRRFNSDEDCYKYLSEIKWNGDGYACKRCGNKTFLFKGPFSRLTIRASSSGFGLSKTFHKGHLPYSRKCNKCKHDGSPTAGTMFDKVKFSLLVAFHIAFKISTKKKGMSSEELSEEYEVQQKTCWEFKWKIQQAMKSSGNYPLTGEVHMDEFYVGGEEEGTHGRGAKKKRLVVVALEIIPEGVGRAYAEVIDNASSKTLRGFFHRHISKDDQLVTDEWNGYKPLIDEYKNMIHKPSNKGENFPQLHLHIMNVKDWLRGIHHHCTRERLQGYLDEYHFRFNRRSNKDTIFDVLIRRMVYNKPVRL